MSESTSIEWTDHTFNVAWGCMKVSPGCENCYALTLSRRYGFDVWGPEKTTERRTFAGRHWTEPLRWNTAAKRDGVRRRVFCSSMADVFERHKTIAEERLKLWPLIKATPFLDWQLLTKRPEEIAANLPDDWGAEGYPNVWLGTSVESQDYAERITTLLQIPARVRFLSLEPLLGPIDMSPFFEYEGYIDDQPVRAIDWAIIGGESGPGARPFNLSWARDIVRQRDESDGGTRLFVKQFGARPFSVDDRITYKNNPVSTGQGFSRFLNDAKGGDMAEWPDDLRIREFPKVAA